MTTLTAEQTRRLQAIQGYSTKYEIALTLPDGRKMLFRYGRKSRSRIAAAVCDRRVDFAVALGVPLSLLWLDTQPTDHPGAVMLNDGATVGPTGRTQRDAIMAGELPRIPSTRAAQAPA